MPPFNGFQSDVLELKDPNSFKNNESNGRIESLDSEIPRINTDFSLNKSSQSFEDFMHVSFPTRTVIPRGKVYLPGKEWDKPYLETF